MNETRTVGGVDARLLLGALHLGGVAPLFLAAGIILTALLGGGILSGDGEVLSITAGIGTPIALLLIVIAVPGIITGIGLIRDRPWAPTMALVMAVFTFLAIPVGTVISFLTVWIYREDLERMFGGRA